MSWPKNRDGLLGGMKTAGANRAKSPTTPEVAKPEPTIPQPGEPGRKPKRKLQKSSRHRVEASGLSSAISVETHTLLESISTVASALKARSPLGQRRSSRLFRAIARSLQAGAVSKHSFISCART